MKPNHLLEVKPTRKCGRGLFATRKIKKGEIVEISPVIELEAADSKYTWLNCYVFGWTNDRTHVLALGLGSLFNHSCRPNVTYNPVFSNQTLIFVASRDILKGHQCFINYGYDPKYGLEATERNKYDALRKKFDPEPVENIKNLERLNLSSFVPIPEEEKKETECEKQQ